MSTPPLWGFLLGATFTVAVGCHNKTNSDETAGAASVASAATMPSAPSVKPPWYLGDWRGTYESSRHQINLSPKLGGPKQWQDEDGRAASGAGTIRVSIDEKGNAAANAAGALGALRGTGVVEGERLAIRLQPEEPKPGFSGLLLLERKHGALGGTLRVSSANSLTVRQSEILLKKAE